VLGRGGVSRRLDRAPGGPRAPAERSDPARRGLPGGVPHTVGCDVRATVAAAARAARSVPRREGTSRWSAPTNRTRESARGRTASGPACPRAGAGPSSRRAGWRAATAWLT